MKAIQTTNKGGNPRFSNNHYIKLLSNINRTGLFSAFTFVLLALTCLFPISKGEQSTEAVTGTAQSSSLTLNVTGDTASVELDVNSTDGTFASSSADNSAAFSVTTNNFSGYTLSIAGSDDEGKLYNRTKQNFLSSISANTTEAAFSANKDLNGKWGYKPSKFNSKDNTNYLPAPTTTASTLDATTGANTTANNYTVALGLRANYDTTANTYTNAFVITAVPNPIAYVITYAANTTDTVSNMPAAQNSTTSATEITLSDKTPAREGYDFKGWCTVAPAEAAPDTCTGLTFQPGDAYGIDQTVENITTLYAMWKRSGIEITYDANGGYFSDNTSKTTNAVVYDPNITKVKKISKSSNIDDSGNSTGAYTNSSNVTDTVTIPGATELHVTITYQTEDIGYDWVAIYDDSVTPSSSNYAKSITGKLGGTTKVVNKEFTIPGDTAQFYFKTDSSGNNYYGYYATIEWSSINILSGEELTPTRDGYKFDGWYKDANGTAGNEFELTAGITSKTVYAKWRNYSTITFSANANGTVDRTTQTVLSETPITISGNKITVDGVTTTATANSGYFFNGWANNCGSTMPANDCTITATWKMLINHLTEASSMQTLTTTQCSTSDDGAKAALEDTRDNKTYNIAKINGVCTMIDNLRIDKGQAMTTANTNIASNYTMPSTDLTSGISHTDERLHQGDVTTGNWYNYCAATAGTICTDSNNTSATYDICPKGWRLPTKDELTSIISTIPGSYSTNVSVFNAVAAGYYINGSLSDAGSIGSWWTSTALNTTSRYCLRYITGTGLHPNDSYSRNYGISVRCVLK